jgi:hypothetical protein
MWSALAVGLASLPYALGYLLAPKNEVFMGLLPYFNDANSYLAKMMEGFNGHWLFYLPYTSEDHPGAPLFLTYLLLGKMAALSGLPAIVTFHLARVVGGFLLLLLCYRFLVALRSGRGITRLAFLLACFLGGAGWITLVLPLNWLIGNFLTVDLTGPVTTLFWALFTFPHHLLGIGLIVSTCWAALHAFDDKTLGTTLLTGLLAAASGFVHPTYPAILLSIIIAYGLLVALESQYQKWHSAGDDSRWDGHGTAPSCGQTGSAYRPEDGWRRWFALTLSVQRVRLPGLGVLTVVGTAALLSVVYQYSLISGNWALNLWQEQSSRIPLGGFGQYAFAYGPLTILALAGCQIMLRRRRKEALLLIAWAFTVPALIAFSYCARVVPLAHGLVRASIGWTIPLSVLAAVGVHSWLIPLLAKARRPRLGLGAGSSRYHWRRIKLLAAALIFVLGVPSTLLVLMNGIIIDVQHRQPYYLVRDEVAALEWLRDRTKPIDVVLAGTKLSTFVPATAGNRTYLGHGVDVFRLLAAIGLCRTEPTLVMEWRPSTPRPRQLKSHRSLQTRPTGPNRRGSCNKTGLAMSWSGTKKGLSEQAT